MSDFIIKPFICPRQAPKSKDERKQMEDTLWHQLTELTDRVKQHDMSTVMECVKPTLELFKLWSRDWTEPFYVGRPYYYGWLEILERLWQELALTVRHADYEKMSDGGIEKLMVDITITYATLITDRRNRQDKKYVTNQLYTNVKYIPLGMFIMWVLLLVGGQCLCY
jgi:hypothetical protein